mmetsp:Transcript_5755/g.16601  ORF Transcript_5755/g.16601 Transcript_5755/m.16601 type:complete len:165 (-) Transcript_5755:842-1336(-)
MRGVKNTIERYLMKGLHASMKLASNGLFCRRLPGMRCSSNWRNIARRMGTGKVSYFRCVVYPISFTLSQVVKLVLLSHSFCEFMLLFFLLCVSIVPRPHKGSSEGHLGKWVRVQRLAYKEWQQGKGKMTDEQVAKLEGIGFTWQCFLRKSGNKKEAAGSGCSSE